MKYRFSDIEEGSSLLLMLHNGNLHMKMDAVVRELVREDIATIQLQTSVSQILKFDGIDIEVIYTSPEGYPYMWRRAKIVYFKGNYVLQVKGDGARYNRRCTYRVGVSRTALLRTIDGRDNRTIVKDVSLSGFSITDRVGDLKLQQGDVGILKFEDLGHMIDIQGSVIRVEKGDSYVVYGFTITRSCKDLPSYITNKQRRKRNNLPPSYVLDPSNGGDS